MPVSETCDFPKDSLYLLLKRALKAVERLEEARLSPSASLRPQHVTVLAALFQTERLTPGEIATRCRIEPSTLTGLLRALEKEKLLAREYLVHDERTYAVVLTERGRAAAQVATETRAQSQTAVFDELGADDSALVAPLLRRIVSVAERAALSDASSFATHTKTSP